MIEKLPYCSVSVVMKADKPLSLPESISSTVRGALGSALISHNCYLNTLSPDCSSCPDMFRCAVSTLYFSSSSDNSDNLSNPYIIKGTPFHGGDTIEFTLILFGNGVFTIPEVFKALARGLYVGYQREHVHLVSICDSESREIVYDNQIWHEPKIYSPQLELMTEPEKRYRMQVVFDSPWSTKQPIDKIDFDYFIRSCLRRIAAVLDSNGIAHENEYHKLAELSKQIEVAANDLKTVLVERYSSTVDRKIKVSGFVGKLEFEGILAPFEKHIQAASFFGVGKLCVIGLGQFSVTLPQEI